MLDQSLKTAISSETYGKPVNFCVSSNYIFTFETPINVQHILNSLPTPENIFVYLHIRHVCSVFRPSLWTIYSFSAVCLCSIGHSKQINNCTERPDGAGLSPPLSALCCGAVCQERECNINSFSLYRTNCTSTVLEKAHKTPSFCG